MKEIPLGSRKYPGHVAVVDDEDYERVAAFRWSVARKPVSGGALWYATRSYGPRGAQRHTYLHVEVLGAPPFGYRVDHVDGDGENCRRENLRVCTHRQNIQARHNKKVGKSSRFPGVCWDAARGLWYASIASGEICDGRARQVFLGRFSDERAAASAYAAAARDAFGEFTPTLEEVESTSI